MSEELNPYKVGIGVQCSVCHHMKQPRGRSAPLDYPYCNWQCSGYELDPQIGSLWPRESEADFGFPVGDLGVRIVEPLK